jgi:hypothetical protein
MTSRSCHLGDDRRTTVPVRFCTSGARDPSRLTTAATDELAPHEGRVEVAALTCNLVVLVEAEVEELSEDGAQRRLADETTSNEEYGGGV